MNATDIKAAREALDNLDDYARMNTGVNAIGPRKVLEDFIAAAERAVSPAESVTARQTPDVQLLREALEKIVRNEVEVFDEETNGSVLVAMTAEDMVEIAQEALAQPLQQEGGKEDKDLISVLREYLLREMPSGTVIADPTWWAPRIAKVVLAHAQVEAACETCKGFGQIGGWVGQTAESGGYDSIDCPDCTPQPSDNLQQASTAQAEPAKPNADCSGDPANCPDNEGYGCACDPMNKAATATDVVEEHPLEIYADSYELMSAQGCTAVHPISVATDIRSNMMPITIAASPAQATPEGAELTPEIEAHECAEQEIWWNDWKAKNPLNARHSPATAALEAWIARAKIAVSQQDAERQPDGYAYRYPDGYIRHSNGREINGCEPIESIPYFYRAAPPQQVDTNGLPG